MAYTIDSIILKSKFIISDQKRSISSLKESRKGLSLPPKRSRPQKSPTLSIFANERSRLGKLKEIDNHDSSAVIVDSGKLKSVFQTKSIRDNSEISRRFRSGSWTKNTGYKKNTQPVLPEVLAVLRKTDQYVGPKKSRDENSRSKTKNRAFGSSMDARPEEKFMGFIRSYEETGFFHPDKKTSKQFIFKKEKPKILKEPESEPKPLEVQEIFKQLNQPKTFVLDFSKMTDRKGISDDLLKAEAEILKKRGASVDKIYEKQDRGSYNSYHEKQVQFFSKPTYRISEPLPIRKINQLRLDTMYSEITVGGNTNWIVTSRSSSVINFKVHHITYFEKLLSGFTYFL